MKIKFKTVLFCLAFIAAGSLAFDVYFCSGAKCLRKSLCKVMRSASKSGTCCQAKVTPCRSSKGKCGGQKPCCFKKPLPAATIENQFSFMAINHVHPVCFVETILTSSDFLLENMYLSTGPPSQFNELRRSFVCVYII
jgi:hypothetical protein